MKKMISIIVIASLVTALITGCETKEQAGTAIGAGTGALIGSRFGHGDGRLIGVAAGALLGGFIGKGMGEKRVATDRANMQSAIINTPMNNQAQWTNGNTGANYVVTPIREAQTNNGYCREYQTTVTVNGQTQRAYGQACRQPDGSWKMMNG